MRGEGEDGGWAKAQVEGVALDAESGEAILTVPTSADKGFMIIKTKGVK